jgi:hypothetical protein
MKEIYFRQHHGKYSCMQYTNTIQQTESIQENKHPISVNPHFMQFNYAV